MVSLNSPVVGFLPFDTALAFMLLTAFDLNFSQQPTPATLVWGFNFRTLQVQALMDAHLRSTWAVSAYGASIHAQYTQKVSMF